MTHSPHALVIRGSPVPAWVETVSIISSVAQRPRLSTVGEDKHSLHVPRSCVSPLSWESCYTVGFGTWRWRMVAELYTEHVGDSGPQP